MKRPQTKGSRYLLAYFLESKLWKKFYEERVTNYNYWRSCRMHTALMSVAAPKKLGVYVEEYIYDMLECVYTSKLKHNTKDRLLNEISDLERYHTKNKTIKQEI